MVVFIQSRMHEAQRRGCKNEMVLHSSGKNEKVMTDSYIFLSRNRLEMSGIHFSINMSDWYVAKSLNYDYFCNTVFLKKVSIKRTEPIIL